VQRPAQTPAEAHRAGIGRILIRGLAAACVVSALRLEAKAFNRAATIPARIQPRVGSGRMPCAATSTPVSAKASARNRVLPLDHLQDDPVLAPERLAGMDALFHVTVYLRAAGW